MGESERLGRLAARLATLVFAVEAAAVAGIFAARYSGRKHRPAATFPVLAPVEADAAGDESPSTYGADLYADSSLHRSAGQPDLGPRPDPLAVRLRLHLGGVQAGQPAQIRPLRPAGALRRPLRGPGQSRSSTAARVLTIVNWWWEAGVGPDDALVAAGRCRPRSGATWGAGRFGWEPRLQGTQHWNEWSRRHPDRHEVGECADRLVSPQLALFIWNWPEYNRGVGWCDARQGRRKSEGMSL